MADGVSFARDIRPLFNDRDIGSMSSHFDLSSYDDVRVDAEGIYTAIAEGSIPCYRAWPAENVQLFRTSLDSGLVS